MNNPGLGYAAKAMTYSLVPCALGDGGGGSLGLSQSGVLKRVCPWKACTQPVSGDFPAWPVCVGITDSCLTSRWACDNREDSLRSKEGKIGKGENDVQRHFPRTATRQ